MAERVALQIDVEAQSSIKTLGEIEVEINRVNHSTLDLTESNIRLKKELSELELQWKGMPKAMLGMFGVTEKIFTELKEKIKENNLELSKFRLEKQQLDQTKKDVKTVSDEFLHTTDSVLGFGASLGEATAGLMLLTGASEENTHKIEKALGVMFAFSGVADSIRHGLTLWNEDLKATAVGQKIVTAGQWLWTTAVGATSGALKLFRVALMATGIGAIIVGVVALVMNFGKLLTWVKNLTNGMGAFGKVVLQTLKIAFYPFIAVIEAVKWGLKKLGILESDEEKAKKKRAQAERKRRAEESRERKSRIQEIENQAKREQAIHDNKIAGLDNEISIAKSLGKDTVKLEREKLNLIIESTKIQKKLADERIALQIKEIEASMALMETWMQQEFVSKKALASFNEGIENRKQKIAELKDERLKANQDVLNSETDLLVFENEIENERSEKRKERSKKQKAEADERLKREKQALVDLHIARMEADANDILDEKKKAEAFIEIERFKHEKELENIDLTNAEKELLEFEYQQRIADISQEFADKELEKEIAERERLADLQKETDEKDEKARKKKLEDIEEEKQARFDAMNARLDNASAFLDSLQTLNNVATGKSEASQKRAFERNKKIQSAQAMISAARGVVNILGQTSLIPQPMDAIYKGIQIAILAATLGAQLNKINSATFSGGGSSIQTPSLARGGGGGAPSLAPITNTSTLVPQEPQQVYVTETDISNIQNKVAVIETQATIK